MAHDEDTADDKLNSFHLALFLLGGACTGTGLISLLNAFGAPSGDMNTNFAEIGASALDNIGPMGSFDYAIPMLVTGVLTLVFANAVAWRQTGRY